MKKIMILGASILQLPAIQKAKSMGLDVIAVDMNPNAIGFQVDGVKREIISTIDILAVMDSAIKHKIDGIFTLASDMPMRTVAAVSEKMHLVGIDSDTAIKATDKAEMRKALRDGGVPIPMFFCVTSKHDFFSAVHKIVDAGYQCIVKPADNSGSRGICLLDNFECETLEKVYKYSKESSRSGFLMVEEFLDGPEVSVETISIDGECHVIQITDKLTTGAPYFVEMGHSQPCQLSNEIENQIIQVAIDANKAIGIMNGPSHTEIKVTKDGPKIIELGARLGGDNITTHLTPISTGVDMVESCIKIALGEKADFNRKYDKGAAIRYFDIKNGLIKDIKNIEEALKMDGILQVEVVRGKGSAINGIKCSGDRAGFVIAQGVNAKEAIYRAEKALSMIRFELY